MQGFLVFIFVSCKKKYQKPEGLDLACKNINLKLYDIFEINEHC